MAMAAGAPGNSPGRDLRRSDYRAAPAMALADGLAASCAASIARIKSLGRNGFLQADDVAEFGGFGQEIERRHPGNGDDRQARHAFAQRAYQVGAVRIRRKISTMARSKLSSSNAFKPSLRWRPRRFRNGEYAARWRSSCARRMVINHKNTGHRNFFRIGRTTAYDENPGRWRNGVRIIRRFGKGVVTPSPASDPRSNG